MDTHNDNSKAEGAIPQGALDSLAVAPPPAEDGEEAPAAHPFTDVRSGMDASDVKGLGRDPSDEDAKLEVALDETFPSSDAPSNTQPGKGKDPAPSSGFDEEAEAQRADRG